MNVYILNITTCKMHLTTYRHNALWRLKQVFLRMLEPELSAVHSKYVSFETSAGCVFVWVVHICSIKDHAYHHVKTNKMYIIIRIMNAVLNFSSIHENNYILCFQETFLPNARVIVIFNSPFQSVTHVEL